jgi:uncharacterized protein
MKSFNACPIHLPLLIGTTILLALCAVIAFQRIAIDFDIVNSLPIDDPVLDDARYITRHHPMQNRVVIDIGLSESDPDLLVAGGAFVIRKLEESRLFSQVGLEGMQGQFPMLAQLVTEQLPQLFSEFQLKQDVIPLLTPETIRQRLEAAAADLARLDGIGQAGLIALDPLNLRNLVLQRLSHLAPVSEAYVYQGQLIAADDRHLLIIADPLLSGTDTIFSRQLSQVLSDIAAQLDQVFADRGPVFTLTAVGAYRAALDNETIARADTQRAITVATIGIALLLLFAFPRPWVGVLSLLPSIAGILIAFFLFALFHPSISILTLGFGGAIISISVDHGIAYFLFFDRGGPDSGWTASHEIRAVGLLAALTTAGAFMMLTFSGFSILSQIGQFAALGIAASFLFIHTLLPRIFPQVAPPRRSKPRPLQHWINRLTGRGGPVRLAVVGGLLVVMLFFARLEFDADLQSINTVSPETAAAEALVGQVWGDIFSRVYVMAAGDDSDTLRQVGDHLAGLVEQDLSAGVLSAAFVPSMILPGDRRSEQNLAAWQAFWTRDRKQVLGGWLTAFAPEYGFSSQAFTPFLATLDEVRPPEVTLPEGLLQWLGLSRTTDGSGWVQISTFEPGENYRPADFYRRYTADPAVRVFDAALFSQRFGEQLLNTFLWMLLIIGLSVVGLLLVFFLDWRLTLISILPVSFAMICTLGTLQLLGHTPGIPGLMLAIVVFGLGIDYSLFFVRSYQRYQNLDHPFQGLFRMAVMLSAASTLIGFGVLALAEHRLLRSAGLTSFLGIGYAVIGAFVMLPPLLERRFRSIPCPDQKSESKPIDRSARVRYRYRNLEAYPRMFARFKLALDPMFLMLERYLQPSGAVLDIGCGYGIPACWLVETYPGLRVIGLDPDPERVRVAERVLGCDGQVFEGKFPKLPLLPDGIDTVLMLDIMHYLNDTEWAAGLNNLRRQLPNVKQLIIRATIPGTGQKTGWRWIEQQRRRLIGKTCHFRSIETIRSSLEQAGFVITIVQPTADGREETWIIAENAEHESKDL